MYELPITRSITWNAATSINGLIAGSRGMGKSWFSMYLTLKLAKLSPATQIFVIDYKASDVSRWKSILPRKRVAITKEEIFDLLEVYIDLMKKRGDYVTKHTNFGSTASSLGMPLFYLIYDEMGVFAATLNIKEKKRHDELLSQIALLGRQYNFGILAIMQQASVGNSGLSSNIKEQFGLVAHMGNANRLAYRQTFGDSLEYPNEKLERGEGFIWIEGQTNSGYVKPFVAPDLSNLDLWIEFKRAFQNQNDLNYLTLVTQSQ